MVKAVNLVFKKLKVLFYRHRNNHSGYHQRTNSLRVPDAFTKPTRLAGNNYFFWHY